MGASIPLFLLDGIRRYRTIRTDVTALVALWYQRLTFFAQVVRIASTISTGGPVLRAKNSTVATKS